MRSNCGDAALLRWRATIHIGDWRRNAESDARHSILSDSRDCAYKPGPWSKIGCASNWELQCFYSTYCFWRLLIHAASGWKHVPSSWVHWKHPVLTASHMFPYMLPLSLDDVSGLCQNHKTSLCPLIKNQREFALMSACGRCQRSASIWSMERQKGCTLRG